MKGGDMYRLYISLANIIGLQRTLELALTIPDPYLKDIRPFQKKANEHLGGFDGLSERLYTDNKQHADTHIRKWAERNIDKSPDLWLEVRRNTHKLTFMTDKLTAELDRLRAMRY